MGHKNTKKWLVLAAVATALLVVPRRSSRKADIVLPDKKELGVDNQPERTGLFFAASVLKIAV